MMTTEKKLIYDIEEISKNVIDNIGDILDEFGIKYTQYRNRISACCPIHDGDNPEGFGILLNDVGNWSCYSHGCHQTHGNSSIISLIQLLLKKRTSKDYSFERTIRWIAKFLDLNFEKKEENESRKKIIELAFSKKRNKDDIRIPIDAVKNSLKPCDYFINRGYSKDILEKYNVGYCDNPKKEMYNRVVIPFFDDNKEYCVGCCGRSLYEQCKICEYYHSGRCPQNRFEQLKAAKWRNSSGFDGESYLYNFWSAKHFIKECSNVIIVEGPGDVLKLEQANINIGIATLGTKFSKSQFDKLLNSGARNFILAVDNDQPGDTFASRIMKEYSRYVNFTRVELPKKDIGEMEVEDIKNCFRFLETK